MVENKRKRGRPRKEDSKKYCAKTWLDIEDNFNLTRCLNLENVSKSEFLRDAIEDKIKSTLMKHGIHTDNGYDEYDYEDYEDYEADENYEDDENDEYLM